jgi:RNA 3'-terminal phosphate cyclase-like protein
MVVKCPSSGAYPLECSELNFLLAGITNDSKDPCVDTFRVTTLPLLKQFGVPIEDVEFKIITRGAPPQGGGEVLLKMPIVHSNLIVRLLFK